MRPIYPVLLALWAGKVTPSCCSDPPSFSVPLFREADGIRTEEENEEMRNEIARVEETITYENIEPLIKSFNDFSVYMQRLGTGGVPVEWSRALERTRLSIASSFEEYRREGEERGGDGLGYGFYDGCNETIFMSPFFLQDFQTTLGHELGHALEDSAGRDTGESLTVALEVYLRLRLFAYDQVAGLPLFVSMGRYKAQPEYVHAYIHFSQAGTLEQALEEITYENEEERNRHYSAIGRWSPERHAELISDFSNSSFYHSLQGSFTDEEIDWLSRYVETNAFPDLEEREDSYLTLQPIATTPWQQELLQRSLVILESER